jgi:hypothetical protein
VDPKGPGKGAKQQPSGVERGNRKFPQRGQPSGAKQHIRLQSGRWLETGANIQYNQHLNNDLALDYLTRTLLASVKELVRVMTNNKRYGKLSGESEPQARTEKKKSCPVAVSSRLS